VNILLNLLLASLTLAAGPVEKKFSSEKGEYLLRVQEKKIEVKRVDAGKDSPPFLRLRIHRELDRPLEVRLKAIESLGEPVRYTGHVDQWNQSYVGLELEFSFDKKTWRRLGHAVEKILP
jgi:hypothetical protein